MRKIAIVGAGESGAQLALGLQCDGYAVTLLSDRSAAQIRTGKGEIGQIFPRDKAKSPFRTTVQGLWHIGASTHPGPGLSGGSGHLVAQKLTAKPSRISRIKSALKPSKR